MKIDGLMGPAFKVEEIDGEKVILVDISQLQECAKECGLEDQPFELQIIAFYEKVGIPYTIQIDMEEVVKMIENGN